MKFEFENNSPIYFQMVENIKTMIISGQLSAGERLPSVREIAADNKVNPNTVMKALADLEDMKLIFTERTNGKFVTNDIALIENEKRLYAEKLSEMFVGRMENLGYSIDDIKTFLNKTGGKE